MTGVLQEYLKSTGSGIGVEETVEIRLVIMRMLDVGNIRQAAVVPRFKWMVRTKREMLRGYKLLTCAHHMRTHHGHSAAEDTLDE